MKNLLDKNIVTIAALSLIALVVLVAAVAAITGHYDSASVRAFVDDMKWIAGLLGAGVAVGRGLLGAGERAQQIATLNSLDADPTDKRSHV
jgi:hypothetical protein